MTSTGILTLGKNLILKTLDRHVWVDKTKRNYIMENCLLKNANFSIKNKQWVNNIIYH